MTRPRNLEWPGSIWQWDYARLMLPGEYEYWMKRVMPFGWSIISAPTKSSASSTRKDGEG